MLAKTFRAITKRTEGKHELRQATLWRRLWCSQEIIAQAAVCLLILHDVRVGIGGYDDIDRLSQASGERARNVLQPSSDPSGSASCAKAGSPTVSMLPPLFVGL